MIDRDDLRRVDEVRVYDVGSERHQWLPNHFPIFRQSRATAAN